MRVAVDELFRFQNQPSGKASFHARSAAQYFITEIVVFVVVAAAGEPEFADNPGVGVLGDYA